tara:strand:- start:14602 stop:16137 length:1536 start_codon:yes stop_codon:yes gene_type:complete
MKSLSKKARSILKKIKTEKYTIKYDNFDLHTFKELLLKNPKIASTYMEGTNNYPPFEYLHQDVFDSLYKYEPQKIDEGDIDYDHLLNSQVMDAVIESPQYKELRGMTRLDKINAAVGTEIVGDKVKELVEELQDKYESLMDDLNQAAENVAQAQDNADGDEEEGEEGQGKSQAAIELEKAQAELEKAKKELSNVVQKKEKRSIGRMLDMAIDETHKTSDLITNWGIEQDPNFKRGGYQEKMKLLDKIKNSSKLKEIAALMGRYRKLAMSTFKNKVAKGINSIYDIELGKDLGKLIPTEISNLTNPILRKTFHKKFVENNLLQYKYIGKEKKAKGPIVVCIDSSGSMHGAPEVWAKSVAMGLLEIAKAEHRSLHVIHFDASNKHHLHTNSFLKKEAYDVKEVIDMAEFFASGGTLFEPPLELAKDKINDDKEFTKADIVFITDGNSTITNDWLKDFKSWKKSKNVTIHSILVDVTYHTDCSVNLFSDKVTKLASIRKGSDADKVAEIVFAAV